LVRVHSECLTGDIIGSLRCDCGGQLQQAMHAVAEAGAGVIVYLRGHEGRGVGLAHKIRAYAFQEGGLDTVEANLVQGLPSDARSYEAAAAVLADLGVMRRISELGFEIPPREQQTPEALGAFQKAEIEKETQRATYRTARMQVGPDNIIDDE